MKLTIDRAALSKVDLEILDTCTEGTGYWFQSNVRPSFAARYTYVDASDFINGQFLLAASKDIGSVTGRVFMRAPDKPTLDTLISELEEALWQFSFEVVLEDQQTKTYSADPSTPTWDEYVHAFNESIVISCAIQIPVRPVEWVL